MKATGYRWTWIDTWRDGKQLPDGVANAFTAVRQSVDRGVPVVLVGKEAGLIVGYHADGRRIVRPYCCYEEGYKPTEGAPAESVLDKKFVDLTSAGDWAWGIGLVDPQDIPPERHQMFVESLRLAVKLANTERFERYLSGFAALERWVEQLEDDSRFTGLTKETWFQPAHANGYCFGSLWAHRRSAEAYVRQCAAEYQEPIRGDLLAVASCYKQMDDLFGRRRPEFACAWSLMPWKIGGPDKWTPLMRQVQAQVLREVLDLERKAVAKIEAVLPLLDPPTARKPEGQS